MHGMSAFMHHGGQIPECSGGVHEDEGRTTFSQWVVIPAWSFALPAFYIEKAVSFHDFQPLSEVGIQGMEAGNGLVNKFVSAIERFQSGLSGAVHIHIPGFQFAKS